MQSPFKFLDAYDKKDREIFFGREKEIKRLYEMVFQTKLVLMYGVMGVGKTSLIRCGLANEFEESQWLALYLRRGAHSLKNLQEAVKEQILRQQRPTSQADWEALASLFEGETQEITDEAVEIQIADDPLKALEQLYLYCFKPIYLIFDQFEEIFTLGDKQERREFFSFLQNLGKAKLNVKVILSLREEYLADLSDYEYILPNLYDYRIRIEKMQKNNLRQVIEGTLAKADTKPIPYGVTVPDKIIANLTTDKREGVELSYLQVFLDKIYQKAAKKQTEIYFSEDLVEEIGSLSELMLDFLQDRIAEITTSNNSGEEIWQILKTLITDEGTKKPLTIEKLKALVA